jgi:DNA-binding ferritin-like protein
MNKREFPRIEENSVGLPREVVNELVPELDRHVSSMFVLYHDYQKQHWYVEGPQFRDLHLYFEECYNQVHEDLDAIAERMTVLGGFPTSGMSAMEDNAYIKGEPEGCLHIRESLAHDLNSEGAVIAGLRETIRRAGELGDFATRHLLERALLNAEDRAHHIEHYLSDHDSLLRGAGSLAGVR